MYKAIGLTITLCLGMATLALAQSKGEVPSTGHAASANQVKEAPANNGAAKDHMKPVSQAEMDAMKKKWEERKKKAQPGQQKNLPVPKSSSVNAKRKDDE